MLKILGAVLTVTACGLLGMAIASRYAQRPRQLRALQTSLQLLEAEILYGATPLPEAFGRLARISQPPVNLLFAEACAILEQGKAYTATETWEMATRFFRGRSALRDSDLEVLLNFGQGLGASGRQEQAKNLHLAKQQLYQQEVGAEEERRKNQQMWSSMGFLAGLALTLLFL